MGLADTGRSALNFTKDSRMKYNKLSVVIPVYNEATTLSDLLSRVETVELPFPKEIILVDDASIDGSHKIIEAIDAPNVKKIIHATNQGKGAALRSGFKEVTGDIVIIQDADLEYDPQEYLKLLQPILDNKADVVYGSRFVGSGAHRVLYFWHLLGNKFLTLLSNMLTNLNLTDMESCYKVFRKDILDQITIRENRFGFEPEFTAKIARLNCRIYEVGISYSGRTYNEGKKINWRDGVSALRCIIKYRFFS